MIIPGPNNVLVSSSYIDPFQPVGYQKVFNIDVIGSASILGDLTIDGYLTVNGGSNIGGGGGGGNVDQFVTGSDAPNIVAAKSVIGSEGGSVRGTGSVDLQQFRSVDTEVASGQYSSISGGSRNTASGTYSTIGGGSSNTTSGSYSTVGGGRLNTASGTYSSISGGDINAAYGNDSTIGGGSSNITSGSYSTVGGGRLNTAFGTYSIIAGGNSNTASGTYSSIIGGAENIASGDFSIAGGKDSLADRGGMEAYSYGKFSTIGDAQRASFVLKTETTSDLPEILDLNGVVGIEIPSNKVMSFFINIVGARTDVLGEMAVYFRKGAISNIAGTTALVGSVETIGTDIESNPLTDVSITADSVNNTLVITVTGVEDQTWRWVAHVQGVEIGLS